MIVIRFYWCLLMYRLMIDKGGGAGFLAVAYVTCRLVANSGLVEHNAIEKLFVPE